MDSSDFVDDDDISDDENNSVCSSESEFERTQSIESKSFTVLTSADVISQMDKEMEMVSETLHISPASTRIMMDFYKWQADILLSEFVLARDDVDSFFRKAGVINPKNCNDYKVHDTVAECLICFNMGNITGLQCGHKFCRDCWSRHLTIKIVDFGEQKVPCPDPKCSIIVDDVTIKSLVSDPEVLEKYNRLICNSFVKCKRNLSWCNSPGCNFIIDSYDCPFVTCKCGSEFCVKCYDEAHAPISCGLLKKWKTDDSATESYLSAHTKACPKCHVDIEKNGGCPHMTCRSCKHQFCWKCLNPWLKHNSTYRCHTPEEDLKIRENRTKVERLKYCWNRYSYNQQSIKGESQRFDTIWEQFEHRVMLKEALKKISVCRHFLMYSYAFVYYLKENNEVYILEAALDDIEAKVDKVSVDLETYIRIKEDDEDFINRESPIRTNIVDGAAHCSNLRKKWLDRTEEGHVNNTWEYRTE